MKKTVVMAIGAHPDDIEFLMAGTLLMLRRVGCETHVLNVATGSCGSRVHGAGVLRAMRRREAQAAARTLGAKWHPSLVDDLEILYELPLLRHVAAIVREVNPEIVLTHSPVDYMEDHVNAGRLAVTATFARGMSNFRTIPSRKIADSEVVVYHAMPAGLRDPLRRRVVPGAFVNTTPVHAQKLKALAQHRSQQDWLDHSQKMNSYLRTMDSMSREVGRMSQRFRHAEGWRRHLHFGFGPADADPLRALLGKDCLINRTYERDLG
jgi:LmbE family N-acetylglucosaminyl deacetylase